MYSEYAPQSEQDQPIWSSWQYRLMYLQRKHSSGQTVGSAEICWQHYANCTPCSALSAGAASQASRQARSDMLTHSSRYIVGRFWLPAPRVGRRWHTCCGRTAAQCMQMAAHTRPSARLRMTIAHVNAVCSHPHLQRSTAADRVSPVDGTLPRVNWMLMTASHWSRWGAVDRACDAAAIGQKMQPCLSAITHRTLSVRW